MNYIIAHSADCDGIISHALLKIRLKDTKHFLADYPDFPLKLDKAGFEPEGNIIVADIDLNPYISKHESAFERAGGRHKNFSWFDHHEGSITHKDFLDKYCNSVTLDRNKCASLLIYETLFSNNDYAKWLAYIAQDYDYKNTCTEEYSLAQKVQDTINSGFGLERFIEMIAKQEKWQVNGELAEALEESRQWFLKRKAKAYSELESTLKIIDVSGLKVMFGLSKTDLYPSDAPMYLKEKYDADLFVVFYLNKHGSTMVYGNTDEINVVEICNSLGGGGRGNNGGFIFGHKNDLQNFEERAEYVSKSIKLFQKAKA